MLANAIADVHADDPEFWYRFIADELEAGHRAPGPPALPTAQGVVDDREALPVRGKGRVFEPDHRHSIGDRMTAQLAVRALRTAVARRRTAVSSRFTATEAANFEAERSRGS